MIFKRQRWQIYCYEPHFGGFGNFYWSFSQFFCSFIANQWTHTEDIWQVHDDLVQRNIQLFIWYDIFKCIFLNKWRFWSYDQDWCCFKGYKYYCIFLWNTGTTFFKVWKWNNVLRCTLCFLIADLSAYYFLCWWMYRLLY